MTTTATAPTTAHATTVTTHSTHQQSQSTTWAVPLQQPPTERAEIAARIAATRAYFEANTDEYGLWPEVEDTEQDQWDAERIWF